MSATRFVFTVAVLLSLYGCATIGDVAQTIADKAKGASAEPSSTTTSTSAPTAAPINQPKSQPAQRASGAGTVLDSGNNIQFGGYSWLILSRSEAGIRLQATGWAGDQIATDLASLHCKKHSRIAQQAGEPKVNLFIYVAYNFNCVK